MTVCNDDDASQPAVLGGGTSGLDSAYKLFNQLFSVGAGGGGGGGGGELQGWTVRINC